MLTTGLDILRIVAEAEAPLTATAIARRVGLHVSSVSRTLAVLVRHGYLRKPTYHSFAADLGVLALAGQAVTQLPAVARTRGAIEALAAGTGMQATLAALHHDEVLYLHRSQRSETITGVAGGFPLHLSVVGLRLLLDLPPADATAALERAERRYGWDRPTAATPATPADCLARARERLHDGILRIDAWDAPGVLGAAVRVDVAGHAPLAVAIVGPVPADPDAFVRNHLDRGAAAVRTALEEQM